MDDQRKDSALMLYVLIVLAYGNYGVSMHDFPSLQGCLRAASAIERTANKSNTNRVTVLCTPKN